MKPVTSDKSLLEELESLKLQLQEANDTIEAIRTGQIDAIVVENEQGHQLYTLRTADQAYRVFIEKMKEGAVTLNTQEIIVYCNTQFATMTGLPLTRVIGSELIDYIADEYHDFYHSLIKQAW